MSSFLAAIVWRPDGVAGCSGLPFLSYRDIHARDGETDEGEQRHTVEDHRHRLQEPMRNHSGFA